MYADQAAELVPLSLSTAMSRQQTKAAAIYNDGDDADLPALFSPGGDDSEPVRNFPVHKNKEYREVGRIRSKLFLAASHKGYGIVT